MRMAESCPSSWLASHEKTAGGRTVALRALGGGSLEVLNQQRRPSLPDVVFEGEDE